MGVLEKNLARARAFTSIFFAESTNPKSGMRRRSGAPSMEEKELLRAAVIFSIGALDAYLSEVTAEVLVDQLQKAQIGPTSNARRLLKALIRDMDTLALELALTTDPTKRRVVAQDAVQQHLTSHVSNHGSKAIAATLERMGDEPVSNVWSTIDSQLSSFDKLATAGRRSAAILDYWTTNRHKIVHEGVAVVVSGPQARQLIDFIEALCEAIDAIALKAM